MTNPPIIEQRHEDSARSFLNMGWDASLAQFLAQFEADLEAAKPPLPAKVEQLVERLGARSTVRDEFTTCHPLANPDGPAAIATLTAQARQIEAMQSGLEQALERAAASSAGWRIKILSEGINDALTALKETQP